MWPSPYGLFLGFMFVALGQAAVLLYYVVRRVLMHSKDFVQIRQVPSTLAADLLAHVSAPESFLLVFGEQETPLVVFCAAKRPRQATCRLCGCFSCCRHPTTISKAA
jgi:hypothetical protein